MSGQAGFWGAEILLFVAATLGCRRCRQSSFNRAVDNFAAEKLRSKHLSFENKHLWVHLEAC
jgi:hypothetical protein